MFDEDGRKIDIREFPAKMEGMSIDELEHYTVELKAEIERALEMVAKKRASQEAAASIFKS